MDLFRNAARRPEDDPERDDDRPRALSVTRLNERIRGALQRGLPGTLLVRGEISNLSRRNHWYFSLKDDASSVSCVSFRSDVRGFDAALANGDEVIATGRVDHWVAGGRTQIYVTGLERAGRGTLQQQFEALVRELRELGWFDESAKRALPMLPRRVAVITSAGGAAIHDVRDTAARRLGAVGLVLYDVRVQGAAAAGEIAAALRRVQADAARLHIDAVIVTRGGGSLEDLWAFNEREVVEAIHECSLPVVAAIGHESDTTIAELVADVRASTPTQAAMRLIPDRAELSQQVDHLEGRVDFVLRGRLDRARARLESNASRPVMREARAILTTPRERLGHRAATLHRAMERRMAIASVRWGSLDGRWRQVKPAARQAARREAAAVLEARLRAAIERRVDRARVGVPTRDALVATIRRGVDRAGTRLDRLAGGIALVDPTSILGRGFTYTTRESDGGLVRGPGDASTGAAIITHARDGLIRSVVDGDPELGDEPKRPRSRRRSAATSPESSGPAGGLFDDAPD